MKREIELKLRLADVPALEDRLRAAGAKPNGQTKEVNTYYDTPQGTFKSSDQGLRIRVAHRNGHHTPQVIITHKGPRAHGRVKSRAETELTVDNPTDAAHLLSALGFTPGITFEKRRRSWKLDGCLVEIDTLPLLGDFVEVEGPSAEAVMSLCDKLALDAADMIKPSYISMLVSHLCENNITTDYIPLPDETPTT